ncbi:hypothetical protein PROFUN_14902 [Planoprotostelium fungivorum]|uniref:MoaB/Mog domain-containing protein n=1 Tax=Planoprotostelium fungivorum TaxID=1890364 RepID=A0A2P6MYD2_9EUKA|nr:hypothetical protein PROFUN_14902 [Planoprotostelium fungivorum]
MRASTRLNSVLSHLSKPKHTNHTLRHNSTASNIPFSLTPVPPNPLGNGRYIETAGCLIIGDEVLNGKTKDTNSHYLARYCFDLGIDLKKIEVIPDDKDEIVRATRDMVSRYDFVVTSGGIGPTHDDITYESLAEAFSVGVEHHQETIERMKEMNRRSGRSNVQTEEQQKARHRMALFPQNSEFVNSLQNIRKLLCAQSMLYTDWVEITAH